MDRTDRRPAPTVSPISTLTSEEIDALLSGGLFGGDAVLLLATRPDQAGAITEFLSSRGVPVAVCSAPFQALDLFRQRPYAAFVAALADLPPNPTWYVDRLRQIDATIPLCFLREASSQPLPFAEALALAWPLEEEGLERLLRLTAERSPHARAASAAPRAPPPRDAALLADPLFAVQTVLQALVEGESFREALQRWANRYPAIRGTVAVDESADSLRLDARAADREERGHMLRLLLKALGETDRGAAGPASAGPFSIVPTSDGSSPYLALWLSDQGESRETLSRLHPVLDLLRRLPGPAAVDVTDGRGRFVALLASRMRAAQRRGGRLGILALDPGVADALFRLFDALRKTLRGEDWVEVVGPRIYAILEEADQEKCRALLGRLRGSAPVQGMKIVALGWQPGEGGAKELVERAEGILAASDGDRSLTGP